MANDTSSIKQFKTGFTVDIFTFNKLKINPFKFGIKIINSDETIINIFDWFKTDP